jgi:hypothetical protein
MWFFFGTLMLNRGSTELDELTEYEGRLSNIGTTVTIDLKGRKSDIMYFNLHGLQQTLGIYHNTKEDYNLYLERISNGDPIKVYFNANGVKAENINLHVYQLEHDGEILLEHGSQTRTYRKVGLILYLVGLVFSIAPIWFYRTKMRK